MKSKVILIVLVLAMICGLNCITYAAGDLTANATADTISAALESIAGATGDEAITFTDITGHWAAEAIKKMAKKGVLCGYKGLFRPDDPIIRGEMAVILDRMMDYQKTAENQFSDLPEGQFYTEAILKANAAGVMLGDGTTVRPKDYITREETAVMLSKAFAIPNAGGTNTFLDTSSVSDWAKGAVFGMEAKGYIRGFNGYFHPKSSITRAEAVTMINNILNSITVSSTDYVAGRTSSNSSDRWVPVSEISVSPTAMSLISGGATGIITSIISPTNATDKNVIWNSSNTSVAAVNASGVVTPGIAGATTITAISASNTIKTAICLVTVSPTGITGSIGLTDQNGGRFALSDSIRITVTDGDLNMDEAAAETLSVSVTSNLGGVTETIHVTVTETAASSGIFEGTFALAAATNDGTDKLGCEVGNTITATYDDILDAAGADPAAVTATNTVDEGITGSSALTDQNGGSCALGDAMTVTVTDSDLNTNTGLAETVSVAVTSNLGGGTETVLVTLTETAVNSGVFEGTLILAAATNDGTDYLGCVVGNTIAAFYDDTLDASGADPAVVSATDIVDNGITGGITITDINGGVLLIGDVIRVSVTDSDLNENTGLAEAVSTTVTSNMGGGTETVFVVLTETAADSGIFEGTFALSAATDDGTDHLGCAGGNTITAAYDDALDAAGANPAEVTATGRVKGVAGSIGLTDQNGGRLAVGDVMEVSVADMDINDNPGLAETASVTVTSDLGGLQTIHLILTETAADSGIFAGTFNLNAVTNDAQDNLGCVRSSIITASYDDALDPAGADPAAVTVTATVEEGVTGSITLTDVNGGMLIVGDIMMASVTDDDLNVNSGLDETVSIPVTSNLGGGMQTINVTLTETASNSGIFEGSFALAAASDDDADNLGCTAANTITAIYDDTLNAAGVNPAAVTSIKKVKGITGSITLTDEDGGRVSMGGALLISVTDEDLNDNNLLVETVSVTATSNKGGGTETINVTLTETAANSGIFRKTFTLRLFTNDGSDNLGCAVGNTITAGYDDEFDAALLDPPSVTVVETVEEGVSGGYGFSFSSGGPFPKMGDTITFTVNDMDLNLDSGVVETASQTLVPYVSISDSGQRLNLILTETAANSGIFRGTCTLGNVADDANNILQASSGDHIYFNYIDWLNSDGESNFPMTGLVIQ